MDLGFEGGFKVKACCVNRDVHPDWETIDDGEWTVLPKTKFKTVFANDIRKDARTAWVNYFSRRGASPDVYKVRSIVDLVKEAKSFVNVGNVFPDGIDVVTGGFPCQDFSVAGKRLGFDSVTGHDGEKVSDGSPSIENRGHLYMWMRDVISLTLPKVFVAENVKGLVSLADAKQIDNRKRFSFHWRWRIPCC